MDRWKCTVCKFIVDSEEQPKKCIHCNADTHKMRTLFLRIKGGGWGRFMD